MPHIVSRSNKSVNLFSGDWSSSAGRVEARLLLEHDPGMDGLFVASDLMAAEAMAALRVSRRRIPADVAVVGFDDSTAATMADPPLTTIHQPFEQSAAEAVRILNELIGNAHLGPQHVLVPTRLVRRESA